MNWQERETGEVSKGFARFVDSWDEEKTVISGQGEKSGSTEVFNMSADGVPFSFRRVGDKYSIIYGGSAELIHKDTFNFFKDLCKKFFEETQPKFN
ncbi:hypothetical protein [uncultured Acinetobacter sp.]|uniref:hypothetical protein n=1 Tax=uncultured Acinetobacter sp. TaxID=165433 RepID=UPI002587588C|nr:hypothetical protein [uncultured Acinetobacter sp.]